MKFRHGHGFRRSLSAAGTSLAALFEAAGLSLDVALTARDADVINAYVRIGLGIGILACVAIDSIEDTDLVAVETSHLFESHTSWIGFRRGSVLRAYMYDSKRRMS
ncbi:MAG TPA: LysR substrate-binding domain-containing protein [Steroidobacteraceae bacterium]|nr:LysR substrate-binding domain-containing protein [Steroidobacteraceae bacterium]